MTLWELPESLCVGGKDHHINADFRDILEIIGYMADEAKPLFMRYTIAISLFYDGEIPYSDIPEAIEKMNSFISQGEKDDGRIKPKVIDWEQDQTCIIADINKVAGQEIRAIPHLHWWTFLSYFQGIGEGQLSTRVSIRTKIAKHQKLETWEQEYYRENKKQIDFQTKYSDEEKKEMARLNELLNGK